MFWLQIETIQKETEAKNQITIPFNDDYLSKVTALDNEGVTMFEINFRPEGDETRVWITSGMRMNGNPR